MTYHLSLLFWLQMVYFWVAVFLAFYIPGNIFVNSQKVNSFIKITLSVGVGMVLWGLQGFLFGYLHLRWLSYVYLFIVCTLWIKQHIPLYLRNPFKNFSLKKQWLTILLLVIGCFIQLAAVWFDGIPTTQGDYYCCADARDNILHIAIAKSFIQQVPPLEPGLSDIVIKNYHYLSSAVVGELVRVFDLPLIATDYQYMTILITLLLGASLIAMSQILSLPRALMNWILFFFYFGGDLVFALVFAMTHKFDFSMSSLEDGSKFLANYPRAFGIDALIIGICLLVLFLSTKKEKILGIALALVMGAIISLKVYVGIFALGGLVTLTTFLALRKNFSLIPYTVGAVALSLLLYIPVNSGAGALYFTGFWLFENYITQPGFHLIRWELARTIYQQHNSYLRVLSYEFLYIFVYILTIFGTKIVGLFQTKKSLSYFSKELHIFLISGLFVSFLAGSFFQQGAGSGANSFNFLVDVFIMGSFYTALAVYYWIAKLPKPLGIIFVVLILLLTIPRVIVETYKNADRVIHFQGVFIPTDQLQAFAYMRQNLPQQSVVSVDQRSAFGFDRQISYVYLYTHQRMYLSGQIDELDSHSIGYKQRQKVTENMSGGNRCTNAYLLFHSPIQYILTDEASFFASSQSAQFVTKEYQNNTVQLLKVNKPALGDFFNQLKKKPKLNCQE